MQELTLFNTDTAKAITRDIKVFNCELGSVRVVMDNNTPYFMASDLCQVLEYKNGRDTINRLFEPCVAKYYIGVETGKKSRWNISYTKQIMHLSHRISNV